MKSSKMSTPAFAEDSNMITLAANLLHTVGKLDKNADKFDHMMAFFITLMSEKGYRVSSLWDVENNTWSKDVTCIPNDWKHPEKNIYEIHFLLYHIRDFRCKLIGIPIGDWLVLNLVPKGTSSCKTRSISVNVAKHVNMHQKELTKFWHLKELGLRFKNNLLAPVHGEMMMEVGIASPSLQGLPQEIKSVIADMLDEKSRTNLEESCKDFKDDSKKSVLSC